MEKKTAILILLLTVSAAVIVNMLRPAKIYLPQGRVGAVAQTKEDQSKINEIDLNDRSGKPLKVDFDGKQGAVYSIVDYYGMDYVDKLEKIDQFIAMKPKTTGLYLLDNPLGIIIYGKVEVKTGYRFWGITRNHQLRLSKVSKYDRPIVKLEENSEVLFYIPDKIREALAKAIVADRKVSVTTQQISDIFQDLKVLPVSLRLTAPKLKGRQRLLLYKNTEIENPVTVSIGESRLLQDAYHGKLVRDKLITNKLASLRVK